MWKNARGRRSSISRASVEKASVEKDAVGKGRGGKLKGAPAEAGAPRRFPVLERHDVSRLGAFLALGALVLDLLVFLECLEALTAVLSADLEKGGQ